MSKKGLPLVDVFMEKAQPFVECSPGESLGNLINLVTTSFEPILVVKDLTIEGLISIQDAIYHSRMPYMSKAINRAVPGSIKATDRISKAIKEMVEYGWYRIPVVNQKKEVVGQLTAKTILKSLIENETFRQLIVLRTPIRKAALISVSASVKEALGALGDKKNAYGFLIDNESHFVGTISKKSLLKAFNQKVEPHLKAIPGQKGYMGEKIDRNDYPLRNYIDRKVYELSGSEKENKEKLIRSLIASGAHYVAVLDEENIPSGILEIRDLLEATLVRDKTGALPLQLRGFEGITLSEQKTIEEWIAILYEDISKSDKIHKIELSKKDDKNMKGRIKAYEILLQVDFYSGKSFRSK